MTLRRRRVLALTGAVLAGLAGCIGDDAGDENGTGDQPSGQPTDEQDDDHNPDEPDDDQNPGKGDETPGDGKQPENDTLDWTYEVGGSVETAVDGVLYGQESIDTGSGGLLALDAETGERLWRYGETGGYSLFTGPVVDDGVYAGFGDDAVGSGSGEVYALTLDGSEQWVTETGSVYHPPRLTDDSLYVGSDRGTVFCLDRATGESRWTVTVEATEESGPPVPLVSSVRDGVVVVELDGRVLGLDAADGTERWRVTPGDRVTSVAVAERVYLTTQEQVQALSGGVSEWASQHGDGAIETVANGCAYLASSSHVAAFDATSGTQRWFVRTDEFPELVSTPGSLYFGTTGVRKVRPDGETLWQTPLDGSELTALEAGSDGVYACTKSATYRLDSSGAILSEASVGGRNIAVGDRVFVETEGSIVGLSL
jgi:outer membrane protein assembly factor BamB